MTLKPGSGREQENRTGSRYYPLFLMLVFFLILLGYFLAWPIVMTDTDLWYHLSGGRYFWQNGTIAHDAFFSYVTPPKSWYNYYWLFQAIVYKIYQWTNYYGLIVLRAILYFLTTLFIFLFLVRRYKNRTELLFGLFLSIACAFAILGREMAVRPPLCSYFFIVVFLYILEFRRDKIWLLPPLGIFWSNVHGIEYPVMFLMVFAYLAESYWRQFRRLPTGEMPGKRERWLLIFVFYTIFITPGMFKLLQTPFQAAAYQHLYVSELIPIPFQSFFVFAPVSVGGTIGLLLNLIVFLSAAFFLLSLWKRKLRLSHALLFIGAVLLLAKHGRFSVEFTLLSLPLLHHGLCLIAEKIPLPRRAVNFALPAMVVILPLLVFHGTMGNRPAYPFSESNLPAGVARFLNANAPGGKILNDANTGGYLPWALNPKFRIYMDMQMSIFSDTDFAFAQNAFSDVNAFRSFIREYDPSFVSVSLYRPYSKKVIESEGRFVPVFFDQAEVLYVNKSHYADLAGRYALKAIEPFAYAEVIYADQSAEKLAEIFSEASRLLEQDPTNYRAHHILSSISVVRRQYDKALWHAEAVVRRYPEQSHGYALKGDALFAMSRYEEAARLYQKALDMGRTSKAENVYWNLHACYYNMKQYKKAYKVLSKYVNPFNPKAGYKEIYQLGISAASVGKTREAVTFLKIAKMKAPPADIEYVEKIERNLAIQSGDEK